MIPLVAAKWVLFPGTFVTVPLEGANGRSLEGARAGHSQVVVGGNEAGDVLALSRTVPVTATLASLTFSADGATAVLTGVRRVRITSVEQLSPYVGVAFDAADEEPSSEALHAVAKDLLGRFRAGSSAERRGFALWLESLAIPDDVVNFVAANAGFSVADQLKLLELPNAQLRAEVLLDRLSLQPRGESSSALNALRWWLLGLKRWWLNPLHWWAWAVLGLGLAAAVSAAFLWWLAA